MRCADVNVLVYAHIRESPEHDRYRDWLDAARAAPEPLGVIDIVLSGFVRIVTNPRVYATPTPIDKALDFATALRESPSAVAVAPGSRHWTIFDGLCRSLDVRGNAIPDAYLAALAIEHNATWISADRRFTRFRDLRWHHPLDA
jgi:uncharacterized protein